MGPQPLVAGSASTGLAGTLLLSSYLDRAGETVNGAIDLRPHEGVVIDLGENEPAA
jgi:hypothetical protein